MKYSYPQVLLTEIPGEVTLSLSISGCKLKCKNCHSKETWNEDFGKKLTIEILDRLIIKNEGITCILFFGGEWDNELADILRHIKTKYLLKTALYSGLDYMLEDLKQYLNYYKIGKYNEELGGLASKRTNQLLFKITKTSIINITDKLQRT